MPHYSIETHTYYEEKCVKDNRAAPTYRYVINCESCIREVLRQKKCAVAGLVEKNDLFWKEIQIGNERIEFCEIEDTQMLE